MRRMYSREQKTEIIHQFHTGVTLTQLSNKTGVVFTSFFLFFVSYGLVAGVVEEILNLGGHSRHNGAVKECVETGEQERTDNDGDEDLHAGIDVALSFLGSDSRLRSDDGVIRLVLDGVEKLSHLFLPLSFFLFLSD